MPAVVRMMLPMRSIDVAEDLQDGIEAAAMPPMAPDGGPVLNAARPIADPPPRLCEAGPCVHYHRLVTQLDAQNPRAERVNGQVVVHARVFHVTTHHYCYPDVGIESNLGALPVLECNRWVPVRRLFRRAAVRRAYDHELGAWHEAREREAAEAKELQEGPRVDVVVRVAPNNIRLRADPTWSLRYLVAYALDGTNLLDLRWIAVADASGSPIANLDATVAELGLEHGAVLTVTSTKESAL